jgi:hypothetical protein
MAARDGDVICDPDIRFLTPPNLQVCLILCVYDVEHLLWDGSCVNALKNDEVPLWLIYVHDVHYSVVVCYLKWKHLFAQFAIHLLEFDNYLALVYLHGPLGLEPPLQALQVD